MGKAFLILFFLLNYTVNAQNICGLGTCAPIGDPDISNCTAGLDRYLSRAMSIKGLVNYNAIIPWGDACNDPNYACAQPMRICPNGYCPTRYCEDIDIAVTARAALLLDVALSWGDEWRLVPGTSWYQSAAKCVQDINRAYDCAGLQRPIIGASILEWVSSAIEEKPIPQEIITAFSDDPDFRWSEFPSGAHYDKTKIERADNPGTPDISKLQTRMWIYQCATTYIDMGYKQLGLDVVGWSLVDDIDSKRSKSYDLLTRIRNYAASKGTFVLLSSSARDANFFYNSKMLFDFRTSPLRPMETGESIGVNCAGQNVGVIDRNVGETYGQTAGGTAPRGCVYDRIPFVVVFDNHAGICGTPGVPDDLDYCIYGYDESTWFNTLSQDCQADWLKYAIKKVRDISPRGYVSMPTKLFTGPAPSSYRLYESPKVYRAIKDDYWKVNTEVRWQAKLKTAEMIGSCSESSTKYSTRYYFTAENPDLTSIFTWHIQKPDGSWEPVSYGFVCEYKPTESGYYNIRMQQDNLGIPSLTGWQRTVEDRIYLETSFCRDRIIMSPNPANGALTIRTNYPIKDIYVRSATTGMITAELHDVNKQTAQLDVSKLLPAVYIVKVVYDDGNYENQELSVVH
jgi:hypothetical protein